MSTPPQRNSLNNIVNELIKKQHVLIKWLADQVKEVWEILYQDHPNNTFLIKKSSEELNDILNQTELQKKQMMEQIQILHKQKEDFLNHLQKKNEKSYDSTLFFLDEYESAIVKTFHTLFLVAMDQSKNQLDQILKLIKKEKHNQTKNYN